VDATSFCKQAKTRPFLFPGICTEISRAAPDGVYRAIMTVAAGELFILVELLA